MRAVRLLAGGGGPLVVLLQTRVKGVGGSRLPKAPLFVLFSLFAASGGRIDDTTERCSLTGRPPLVLHAPRASAARERVPSAFACFGDSLFAFV